MTKEKISEILLEIPTKDLIEEIMRRCNPAIFIGERIEEYPDGKSEKTVWYEWFGNDHTCYALCHHLSSLIQSKIHEDIYKEKKGDTNGE